MRRLLLVAALASAVVIPSPARAQEHGHFGGFGGLTFGSTTSATTFGGNLGAPLGSHLQIVAEAGHMDNLMPATFGTLLDFTPVDFNLGAWYGEAGVRFLTTPQSAVTPYVEATAGAARLGSRFDGAGRADPFVNAALRFLDRTEPLLGVGGGVILRGGPVTLDLGYRYKKILASDSLQAALAGGNGIDVSQARIGLGFRF
jgi:opacity protein-like surface antigen